MPTATPKESFTLEEFLKFRDFFYRKTGIFFEEAKRYFVDKRVQGRMEATGMSFRTYFMHLRFEASGEELQQLINLMTVNETYFFREDYQMRCMVDSIIPEIVERKKRHGDGMRILSMPTSTGEEPYSLAIFLLEYWNRVNDFDVEIVGLDIDTKALAAAEKGLYGPRSVGHIPQHLLRKYFKPAKNSQHQISDDLRNSIDFRQANLNDDVQMRSYFNFDIIFCRNLLIYFDDISRRQAAETFFEVLNPGGFLCLGHSESMSRVSNLFNIRKFPEAIVYQRPFEK
jgi:chemotaxis protein methyltransferase CheR